MAVGDRMGTTAAGPVNVSTPRGSTPSRRRLGQKGSSCVAAFVNQAAKDIDAFNPPATR
jgi:hypothetical protein